VKSTELLVEKFYSLEDPNFKNLYKAGPNRRILFVITWSLHSEKVESFNIIIIIIIIIITAIELSLVGSSPYTTTEKANKNKYT